MSKPSKLWGCHNKRRVGYYLVPVRKYNGHVIEQTTETIINVNSVECQYRKATPDDPRCAGCTK